MPRVRKILAADGFLRFVEGRNPLCPGDGARYRRAEVIVYHAIDVGEQWANRRTQVSLYRNILEESRRLLDRFLAENFADCIDLVEVRQVVEFGRPHKNIVEEAATDGVDIIVISTHGRTGIDHVIVGSVAEKVVAHAPCPVLVVPRHERQATTARAA